LANDAILKILSKKAVINIYLQAQPDDEFLASSFVGRFKFLLLFPVRGPVPPSALSVFGNFLAMEVKISITLAAVFADVSMNSKLDSSA